MEMKTIHSKVNSASHVSSFFAFDRANFAGHEQVLACLGLTVEFMIICL